MPLSLSLESSTLDIYLILGLIPLEVRMHLGPHAFWPNPQVQVTLCPLQPMFFEGSPKFHNILQLPEFLWDLIKYFNARGSRRTLCAFMMYFILFLCLV